MAGISEGAFRPSVNGGGPVALKPDHGAERLRHRFGKLHRNLSPVLPETKLSERDTGNPLHIHLKSRERQLSSGIIQHGEVKIGASSGKDPHTVPVRPFLLFAEVRSELHDLHYP